MAETSWSVDTLLKLTRRLARALANTDFPYARELDTSIFRLDRCLIEIRKTYSPNTPLLWIDDVGAALDNALREIAVADSENAEQHKSYTYSTSVTTSSNTAETPLASYLSPDAPSDSVNSPSNVSQQQQQSTRSRSSQCEQTSEKRQTRPPASFSLHRRRSLASMFASSPKLSTKPAPQSPPSATTRPIPPAVLNNPFSERLLSSFARLILPTSPSAQSSPSQLLLVASRTVDEWVTAVRAAKEDRAFDDADSCISISDALPPLPQHYFPCRDRLYQEARDALLKASVRDSPPSSSSSSSEASDTPPEPRRPPAAVALVGPHGVGKTMLAMELVHDVDICHNFADGVAWIQLGPDITDEELAEGIIRCVDTIIAGDFRASVRYCNSLDGIVSRASRVLRHVSSLIVIDDVSGPRGYRAFEQVMSAMGAGCVALYTIPKADDLENGKVEADDDETDLSEFVTLAAKLDVKRLDANGQEAITVFRNWLTKTASTESREGSLKHTTDQNTIINRCHGLPLALAMAGGFLSKFHNSWTSLASALSSSKSSDDTIFCIMGLLHTKGGIRFEQQLKAIGCVPHGMWVSLSALADLWGTDYRSIKLSARRLGRMAFGEYRLGDTSDESRVRFHWHVIEYCTRVTNLEDERVANQRLLTHVRRRRSGSAKSNGKIEYLPWWSGLVTDKYLCRRLHWHMARGDALDRLNELICDYQWVCHRLEKDSLLGILTEFRLAMLAEDKEGRPREARGIGQIVDAIQEVALLRNEEAIEMNAIPTLLVTDLRDNEYDSDLVRKFLTSIEEKARRPWLKPMGVAESPQSNVALESISSDSMESEMPYVVNCLTSSRCGKVVCGDRGGNVHVYDPATGKNVVSWTAGSVGGDGRWRGVGALATIGDCVISGHYNGRLLLRSIRTGRTQVLEDFGDETEKITCLESLKDGLVAIGCHSGRVMVMKGVDGIGCDVKLIELEGHCHMVTALYLFPDGERLASSSYDGFAAVWSLEDDGKKDRISLNGHKPDSGHKENYITTFATIGGGKRLLSACRGGVVSAWDSATGDCLWTARSGYEFSRSTALQAFGIEQYAKYARHRRGFSVGYPYVVTRGEGPTDLLILAAGDRREVLATVSTEQVISTWLEVWHPDSGCIFVAVSHSDGRLCCYELVTSLR